MIPVLFCIITIVFTLLYIAPGDPAYIILGAEGISKEGIESIHKEYGLDDPFIVQLGNYIINLCKGDMGVSYLKKQTVISEIMVRFPYTLILAFGSIIVSLIVGITVGIVAAIKQYSALDKVFTMISLFGVSAPSFWVAMLLILLFSIALNLLPPSGSYGPEYWIMPIAITGFGGSAYIMRMTRSSMLEVIRQDYIRTARAKGQTELAYHHKTCAEKCLPARIVNGNWISQSAHLLAGSVLDGNRVFALPGMGKFLIDIRAGSKDYPCVTGTVIWIAFCLCRHKLGC